MVGSAAVCGLDPWGRLRTVSLKRRLYILCGLFALYFASIGLAWALPQSLFAFGCAIASGVLLAGMQIRWLHQDMEETEARISRRVWERWAELDEKA